MTFKNHKNHYNIKLLKGYGISIKQKDHQIQLTDGADPFTGERESESYFISEFPYEKIVLCGDGYISTKAIQLLLTHNVSLVQVDTFGNLIASMSVPAQSQIMTKWRMGQYQTFSDPYKSQELRKYFLGLKVQSQIRLLEYLVSDNKKSVKPTSTLVPSITKIKKYYSLIKDAKTPNDINVIEASTSKIYQNQFASLIPERFEYKTRHSGKYSIDATKENATNVINALLNYGYSVLASDVAKYVNAFGLDPYYGFNHKMGYYMSLVYDIIEPFRVVVESTVLQMANSNANNYGRIHKKHHYRTVKGILLDRYMILQFLRILQNMLNRKRPYKVSRARSSEKLGDKMSFAQESTIIREEVRHIAEYCFEKREI